MLLSRPRRGQFPHLDLCPTVWCFQIEKAAGAGHRVRLGVVLRRQREPRVNAPELGRLTDADLNQPQARVSKPPMFHGCSPFRPDASGA